MEIFPGIETDAGRRSGKPCIAGTRLDVATVVAAVAAGESIETVAREYAIDRDQVRAALRFAAHLVAHQAPAVAPAS